MNYIFRFFTTTLFLTASAHFCCSFTCAQTKTTGKDLPNFYIVNSKLYRGGQPSEAGVMKLKEMGVGAIIDFRGVGDKTKSEEQWAQTAGLKFYSVPLDNWHSPKDANVDKILTLINSPDNQPVFVHCQRGADRTGTIVAVYRITHDGWTGEQANEEARKFGFGWWQVKMKDYINDYYRDYSKPTQP
jgi:tyrosine-protein phosphatase SIW14